MWLRIGSALLDGEFFQTVEAQPEPGLETSFDQVAALDGDLQVEHALLAWPHHAAMSEADHGGAG